jgi:hypothetical protein
MAFLKIFASSDLIKSSKIKRSLARIYSGDILIDLS